MRPLRSPRCDCERAGRCGLEEEGKHAVLGLATGSTPVVVYAELVRMHKAGQLSIQECNYV